MTLFEVVISKNKLWQKISRYHAGFLNVFPKELSQQSKDWINVLSGPKWHLIYTQLIVDQKWEMSLLKTDTLLNWLIIKRESNRCFTSNQTVRCYTHQNMESIL